MVSNNELLKGLEDELKEFASNPDAMFKKWQITRKQFHNYSLRNILIANQQLFSRTEKTVEKLASYRAWQKVGRQVRKGEKGLKILAPLTRKNDDDTLEVYGFKQVTVFDISQTDGEDLFFSDEDIEGNINISLEEVISKSNIPIKVCLDTELTKGETDYKEIRLSKLSNDDEKVCVIFHELAHNLLLHNKRKISDSLKEMEAESVAYIVGKYYGITNKGSIRYIHNWNVNNIDDFSLESANNIVRVADEIVSMMS